jgi:hypothetical protein
VTRPGRSDDTIGRLADALLKKRIVPFLGAGFSYGAHHPSSGWSSEPTQMPRQIKEWLGRELICETGCATQIEKTLCTLRISHSLSELAELGSTLFGAMKVCDVLRIHEYADLRPEPQHRYLAYLAREGLVNEIITTNYDCCLETAFEESFLPGHMKPGYVGVVRNLEEYRQNGSRHPADGHLLVYKINGCARAYALARETYCRSSTAENQRSWDVEAERIILTERQLQSFRDQVWARDLLRDRFRSRQLFFCGFGNAEPQVRHTVLTLIGEFANGRQRAQRAPEETMELPNAPFVHCYDGTLSFNQLQMLVAFMDAHSVPRFAAKPLTERLRPVYRNVLAPSEGKPNLCASTVMKEVFREVFIRLIRRALRDGEPFTVWLREVTPEWRTWRNRLLRVVERNRYSVRRMLSHGPDRCFPLTLHRYLWVILYPESRCDAPGRCPEGWYLPLREDPLFLLTVALWLCLFNSCRHRPEPTPTGLRMQLPEGGSVHLVARDALSELQANTNAETNQSRLLRMIVVPTLRRDVDAWGRWRVIRAGRLRPGRWIAVESANIIRGAQRPEAVSTGLLWEIFAAAMPRRPAARLRSGNT